ncbi:hypothetical protein AURDEDRAFT_70501 [Auricularia subglabra TFB-10046 SS5]|uniref:Uncharacterized protein n=1 Tax=Auricularia subglabra (strain TFB-10046 / SS5) TaxID=717982 RepID=J0LJF1_AURST|nr:hypothetical protein AURDEDRAFT_70501 [Auricularia subglabra TFB-10046 SS5]
MTNEDKQLETLLKREEKEEERSVQHALKDLKATEKANSKAHKAADKAMHAVEKAQTKEHKTSKTLSKATHKHDDAVAAVTNAERNIGIKQRHLTQLEGDLEQKKQHVDEVQRKKEQHDSIRNAKRAEMLGYAPIANGGADQAA